MTSDARELVTSARLGLVFTRREALAAGVTLAQLRGPAFKPVYRGVFTTVDDPERLDIRAVAAVKLAGPDSLVCAETGLELLGAPLPDANASRTVHVWVPSGKAGPDMTGVRVHRGRLNGIAKRLAPAGLFSADPCDCWLQLAEAYSLDDLVVVADGLMRYTEPIVFQFQLADAVGTAHRLPGLRRAREALKLARDGTDSPAETRLRLALVKDGLPCPEVNYPVRPDGVRTVYRLDMAYPANHVAVEYDGAIHVGNSAQMRRDQTRRRRLEDWGWRVITATATDLHDPAEVVASVRQALADSA